MSRRAVTGSGWLGWLAAAVCLVAGGVSAAGGLWWLAALDAALAVWCVASVPYPRPYDGDDAGDS